LIKKHVVAVEDDVVLISADLPIGRVAGEWEELADRLGASPFARPGWVGAWWRAFGAGKLEIICARRGGTLVGVLPLARQGSRVRSPTNYHTPEFFLLAEDEEALRALATAVFRTRPRRVSIGFLDARGDGFAALERAAVAAGYRVLGRPMLMSPYVVLDTDWETYEQRLPHGERAGVRRYRRQLAKAGTVEVDYRDGKERLDDVLADVFRVEERSWKATAGTAIPSHADTRGFYEEVAQWAATCGTLHVTTLRLDRRPVAMEFGIRHGGVHYALKGSYDAEYRRFSPGRVIMHSLLEDAFAHGLRQVDLLGADDPYKRAWAQETRERRLLEAFARTPAGSLGWLAESRGHPVARRVGLQRLLKRIRRKGLRRRATAAHR
jgi:CelD/BcsL family acetyltransferase involved in cellulose biosynthesis